MRRKIIIDTDPGTDDALALLWALAASAELEVLGIVAVAGNLPLALTEKNARRVCELAGCARPLLRSPVAAASVHGETGLGALMLPEPSMPLQPRHGVDFLIDALRDAAPANSSSWAGRAANSAMSPRPPNSTSTPTRTRRRRCSRAASRSSCCRSMRPTRWRAHRPASRGCGRSATNAVRPPPPC